MNGPSGLFIAVIGGYTPAVAAVETISLCFIF